MLTINSSFKLQDGEISPGRPEYSTRSSKVVNRPANVTPGHISGLNEIKENSQEERECSPIKKMVNGGNIKRNKYK
jgi:hypothetical protein